MTAEVEYVYVSNALSTRGWGISGVFRKDVIERAPDTKGRPIVNADHLIVGSGEGWDAEPVIDQAWLEEACRRMKGWEPPKK